MLKQIKELIDVGKFE